MVLAAVDVHFRYPVSVVKAIPSHSPLSHALSAVSEADSTTENGMNTRSPGDGACLPSFNNMESIREVRMSFYNQRGFIYLDLCVCVRACLCVRVCVYMCVSVYVCMCGA